MFESFDLFVSYSQICVFDPDLVNPFNDWRPEHWQQGFSWRPATVSFRTLVESGITIVEVQTSNEFQIAPTAVRAILVPFEVNPEGVIEISSINRGRKIQMPHGKYTLIFETEIDNKGRNLCRFLFIRAETAKAQILRKDSNLSPIYPLTMESGPAIWEGNVCRWRASRSWPCIVPQNIAIGISHGSLGSTSASIAPDGRTGNYGSLPNLNGKYFTFAEEGAENYANSKLN